MQILSICYIFKGGEILYIYIPKKTILILNMLIYKLLYEKKNLQDIIVVKMYEI
jgi:hypothetical protein